LLKTLSNKKSELKMLLKSKQILKYAAEMTIFSSSLKNRSIADISFEEKSLNFKKILFACNLWPRVLGTQF